MGLVGTIKALLGLGEFALLKKSPEWFISEEGKQTYEKYRQYSEDMRKWVYDGDFWEGIDFIGSMVSSPVDTVMTDKQKQWPCRYWYFYLVQLHKKNKDNLVYSGFLNDKVTAGLVAFLLGTVVSDNWPDVLKPEENPILNYLLKQKIHPAFLHTYESRETFLPSDYEKATAINFERVHLLYVNDMFAEGIDASDETWLYDENIYKNARGDARQISEIISMIRERVANRDLFNSCVQNCTIRGNVHK